MISFPRLLAPAMLALACCVPGLVQAATACSVSTIGVAFGAYSSIRNVSRDSTGSVDVTCTDDVGNTVSYAVTLTSGTGSYGARQLASGANRLAYNVFKDSGRSLVWGDGTGGSTILSDSYTAAASPTLRSYPVYGRIPAGQTSARVGAYTDSIVVTVTY